MTSPRPLHFLTETRSPESGKLDARLTARTLGLSMRELAQVLGRDPSGLSKHPASERLQPSLQALDELALHLRDVFGSLETGRMWLRAPNPVLAAEAPVTYLLRGDVTALRKLLLMAETGMPT
ncbi:hypothetical protein DEIPH_ctg069orf0011 [Deinococcus phoenicis]|uniref:Antitoxin Xre/MbcA/ParS-like toxin-binding domain-containing protein n=1 Tax=Deinococcus phoenicis TaxID=1476583 RepID=A0A016QKX0_9DEIO|nr:antitoxin Xre/MbcA/ParS toxin-binding domain-containing protein [Deinococcus phoenicis]EYB66810.1 hypothetical protein DEIPH_ctg069orf0011 [Deinococcus phoenicis]